MWILIVALVVLGTVAAGVSLLLDKDTPITYGGDCVSCGGTDVRCGRECMFDAATSEPEYFDDEELDRFRGRAGDSYSDEEADMFRTVMEELRGAEELRAWGRSLVLRGINLPDALKDEFILLCNG
ncbi:MAG: hypothetical protein LUC49_07400 [Prevotella sp.]|nr:hypothetical protein [Prevotella sp.]